MRQSEHTLEFAREVTKTVAVPPFNRSAEQKRHARLQELLLQIHPLGAVLNARVGQPIAVPWSATKVRRAFGHDRAICVSNTELRHEVKRDRTNTAPRQS